MVSHAAIKQKCVVGRVPFSFEILNFSFQQLPSLVTQKRCKSSMDHMPSHHISCESLSHEAFLIIRGCSGAKVN